MGEFAELPLWASWLANIPLHWFVAFILPLIAWNGLVNTIQLILNIVWVIREWKRG